MTLADAELLYARLYKQRRTADKVELLRQIYLRHKPETLKFFVKSNDRKSPDRSPNEDVGGSDCRGHVSATWRMSVPRTINSAIFRALRLPLVRSGCRD